MTSPVSMLSLNMPGISSIKPDIGIGPAQGKSFKDILSGIAQNKDLMGGLDMQADMNKIQNAVAQGNTLPAAELISYQIKAGQVGLRVELLSKLAEAMSSTVRKFQSGQA